MTATKAVTLADEPYPKVSQVKTQIYEAEEKLHNIRQKERLKLEERGALLGLPDTQENNERLNRVETEILTLQAQKDRLVDRIDKLNRDLPVVLAEAKQTEAALETAQENRKKIKSELKDLDKELNEILKKPMDLIQQRKTTIDRLERAGDEIQTLTSVLRWHPPTEEYPPALPEMMKELKEVLDKLFPRRR